jgi:hypothetical protein
MGLLYLFLPFTTEGLSPLHWFTLVTCESCQVVWALHFSVLTPLAPVKSSANSHMMWLKYINVSETDTFWHLWVQVMETESVPVELVCLNHLMLLSAKDFTQ